MTDDGEDRLKNITLSVDERVLHEARVYAAKRGTSVNALVRGYLDDVVSREDRIRHALERIRELSEQSTARIGPRTWTRDDLHARGGVR